MRDVEIDAIQPALLHLEVDGPGHHVARCEFAAWVVAGHEAAAVGQQQASALAAYRLGDQEGFRLRVVEAGRMKLDKFHIRHPAAGTPRHRDPVSG
jgi:hypothetical protein